MQEISSRENRIFKDSLKLLKKKYRDETALYLIEGENLLNEAFKCNVKLRTIFYKDGYDGPRFSFDNSYVLSSRLFDELAQTETPQGIMGVVEKKKVDLMDFLNMEGENFVVLDKVQDPGNVGTIIRTADASGYKLMILIKGSCDVYQPKVVRSTAGSLFRLPIVYVDSYDELMLFTKKAKKKLVATTLDSSLYYYDTDLSKDVCLVVGNEGNGVSTELINNADIRIKIPMNGNIESLNCAVATGILLYERVRKCKKD